MEKRLFHSKLRYTPDGTMGGLFTDGSDLSQNRVLRKCVRNHVFLVSLYFFLKYFLNHFKDTSLHAY